MCNGILQRNLTKESYCGIYLFGFIANNSVRYVTMSASFILVPFICIIFSVSLSVKLFPSSVLSFLFLFLLSRSLSPFATCVSSLLRPCRYVWFTVSSSLTVWFVLFSSCLLSLASPLFLPRGLYCPTYNYESVIYMYFSHE